MAALKIFAVIKARGDMILVKHCEAGCSYILEHAVLLYKFLSLT